MSGGAEQRVMDKEGVRTALTISLKMSVGLDMSHCKLCPKGTEKISLKKKEADKKECHFEFGGPSVIAQCG